ncbi:MAG: SGNH/GDSL hydrolase family protein [Deltaproteobacteria bacterium]|nr:SGNH/GDSL hydrolase family protein [Deltaproteobacteria bacterium]
MAKSDWADPNIPNRKNGQPAETLRGNSRWEYLGLALVFVQVAAIAGVLHGLDLQTAAFRRVVDLAAVGFVVNHLLPLRWRLRFFVFLSAGAVFLVMGGAYAIWWDFALAVPRALAILAYGGALIGAVYLPIGFWRRVGLILALAGLAALFRVQVLGDGTLAIVWPVLAAMFMFRLITYLYDLSTAPQPPPLGSTLAYFFLLPNVCCLLFPVVDFKTFRRSYYNEEPLVIYQRGTRWMARGVIQLLAYRFVELHLYLPAALVHDGAGLIQFILTNSLLYLKVSGLFHLIAGLLLLFGFNLPKTNHRYFLASSFTDYWRRVNIYWRDFILKVFYYPTFFRLKTRPLLALGTATLLSFVATWALHLYQSWWLKGKVAVTGPDVLFWLILGLLVLGNAFWEMKRSRGRKLATNRYRPAAAFRLALQTAGTFACISLLWSLWSSPSLASWLALWRFADGDTLLGGAAALAVIMAVKILMETLPAGKKKNAPASAGQTLPLRLLRKDLAWVALPMLLLLAANRFVDKTPDEQYPWQLVEETLVLGDSKETERHQGYYENLLQQDEANQQLWETFYRLPFQDYTGFSPTRPVGDFRFLEPIPSSAARAYDTEFRTNRWSMRDREYPPVKPEGTFRIALLGSSHVMGWGVPQKEVMGTLLAERLNSPRSTPRSGRSWEVLNFAFNGYSPLSQVALMKNRIQNFAPDLVLYVAHTIELQWAGRDLAKAVRQQVPIPQDELSRILETARVDRRSPQILAQTRLRPFERDLVSWAYRELVAECRLLQAQPIFVFLPLPYQLPLNAERSALAAELKKLAADTGFGLIDLTDIFDHQDPRTLLTRPRNEMWTHLNGRAHQQVAERLYRELTVRLAGDRPRSGPSSVAGGRPGPADKKKLSRGGV